PSYVVPTNLFQGIKAINPMFRGYSQQEFLRCLMDQLHEELKESVPEPLDLPNSITMDDVPEEDNHSQSDDFNSCESCGSSERADNEVQSSNIVMDNTNEAEMLIPEQDEIQANREWQKEKNMINDLYRSGVNGVIVGINGADIDKDVDTTTETTPIISSQGALKVQGRTSGNKLGRFHNILCHVVFLLLSLPLYIQHHILAQVSVTLENFQDISLPIPGKEDLAKLHSASHQTSLVKAGSCGEAYAPQGWIAFVMEYIKRFVWNKCTGFTGTPHYTFVVLCKFVPNEGFCLFSSWFWGPVVTLQDCLAAFFARDELKGMYIRGTTGSLYTNNSCFNNQLHELMYSTKIGTHVSFPLEGLDLQPFLAKDSSAQTTSYDLLSVICHHGTASSEWAQNDVNNLWYEFDDQSVTEVSESCVQNAEAYVLFYKKSNEDAVKERRRVSGLLNMMEPSVPPNKASCIDDLVVMLPQNVWDHLYSRCMLSADCTRADSGQISEETWNFLHSIYGGGPLVTVRPSVSHQEAESSQSEEKIEVETRSV
ncbi:hypothetical protein XENOCAPTIV_000338, partial [Xenoophorus captivus]